MSWGFKGSVRAYQAEKWGRPFQERNNIEHWIYVDSKDRIDFPCVWNSGSGKGYDWKEYSLRPDGEWDLNSRPKSMDFLLLVMASYPVFLKCCKISSGSFHTSENFNFLQTDKKDSVFSASVFLHGCHPASPFSQFPITSFASFFPNLQLLTASRLTRYSVPKPTLHVQIACWVLLPLSHSNGHLELWETEGKLCPLSS
jgi:hypothetical protein